MGERLNIAWGNFKEIPHIHPTLMSVVGDWIDMWPVGEMWVTSMNRTREEDAAMGASGVHSAGPPWRALDVRVKSLPGDYQHVAEELARRLNSMWVYDPSRPSFNVCFAQLHGTGPHAHLQVCDATVRR